MGQSGIYLLYPKTFCSCQDFYKNVIINKKRIFCKHIIAQIIVEALGNYSVLELEDNDFKELVEDLRVEDEGFGIIQ
jgi:predicted nucleic acid-binding Zn finger protein